MRILLLMYRLFGRWGFRVVLAPVLVYFFISRKQARESSTEYLKKIAPRITHPPPKLSVYRHFWMFGEILLDKLLVWMGELSPQDIVVKTPEVFDELNNKRRGGVIIVSHLGNNEMTSALAERFTDVGVTMLVYTRHAKKFNHLMKSAQQRSDIRLMQVVDITPATAMMLSDRVSNGEYIAIAGDRTPVTGQHRVSRVQFLGAKASLPQGAFILAGVLACPVYLLFCIKQGTEYNLYLEQFTERFELPRRERQTVVGVAVQQYADRLAHYCTLAPLQWFNFFPFWRS